MTARIETPRFVLRELQEHDVSERYLGWFKDQDARANISAAATTRELDDLRRYVADRSGRDDVLFLGIFEKASGLHIGNVKYEPVDSANGYAVMGILIGDPAFRGRGVATEVLAASGEWLKANRGIREIALGVHRRNAAAIKSYEKAGYRVGATPRIPDADNDAVTMVLVL